jgi:hypothetical protein
LSFAGNSVHSVGDILFGLVEGGLARVGSDFLLGLGAPIFSSRVRHVFEIYFVGKVFRFGVMMARKMQLWDFYTALRGPTGSKVPMT